MDRKALVVWGGWDGHQPEQVAQLFGRVLKDHGFTVEIATTLDAFLDKEKLTQLSLIVPVWTMGKLTGDQGGAVCEAVRNGVGLAGCHGGMCDAFREHTEWQFMTGGQWVAHPGGIIKHTTRIVGMHWITEGVSDFEMMSEQYYMHVDPAVKVLASSTFPIADGPHAPNGEVHMPATWTKMYGKGRVFYTSVGHSADVLEIPSAHRMATRGLLWAARAEQLAR